MLYLFKQDSKKNSSAINIYLTIEELKIKHDVGRGVNEGIKMTTNTCLKFI